MTIELLNIELRNEAHIAAARRRARDIAVLLGFENQDSVRIATTVSEIARNAYRYAGGGRITFRFSREPDQDLLAIEVRDQGPGITDLAAILDGRYHSQTGMGLGLLSGKRLMDRFSVETSPQGTTVQLGKFMSGRHAKSPASIAAEISAGLARLRAPDALSEAEDQNRELLRALADFQSKQIELTAVNRELEETNRGVVALYAELDDRARDIQKVADLKTRFISNITHEFRTPLHSIISLSRMLLERIDGELSTEQEKQSRFINRAARDLADLVNDLLDLAKSDAGKVELQITPVSVGELFATLRGMLRPLIEANARVALVFEEPATPVEMFSDERKLSQILRNLISNALKYTESGEVRISARHEGNRVIFSVRDTGIGIPEEHQDKIFEEFYQVRNPLQQKTKGTGLGLALSRRFAALLGGAISLQSSAGQGSTFWVNLPRSSLPQGETQGMQAVIVAEKDPATLVLFVDAEVGTLLTYERMLEPTAFKAILARDPAEALKILQRVSVTAVVMSSATAVQTLTAQLPPSPALLPSFIVCGPAPRAGEPIPAVDAFLPAPVQPAELITCLEKLTPYPRLNALIIDDDATARHLLRVLLEEFNLTVFEAGSAIDSLTAIERHQPALVFVDPILPDQSGASLVARLRKAIADNALIIHSSRVFTEEDREFFRHHSTALIRKAPVTDSSYRTAIIHELANAKRRHLHA